SFSHFLFLFFPFLFYFSTSFPFLLLPPPPFFSTHIPTPSRNRRPSLYAAPPTCAAPTGHLPLRATGPSPCSPRCPHSTAPPAARARSTPCLSSPLAPPTLLVVLVCDARHLAVASKNHRTAPRQ